MKRELYAELEKFDKKEKDQEHVFTRLYMVAGYPQHAYKEDFCLWVYVYEPTDEEIVNYFLVTE